MAKEFNKNDVSEIYRILTEGMDDDEPEEVLNENEADETLDEVIEDRGVPAEKKVVFAEAETEKIEVFAEKEEKHDLKSMDIEENEGDEEVFSLPDIPSPSVDTEEKNKKPFEWWEETKDEGAEEEEEEEGKGFKTTEVPREKTKNKLEGGIETLFEKIPSQRVVKEEENNTAREFKKEPETPENREGFIVRPETVVENNPELIHKNKEIKIIKGEKNMKKDSWKIIIGDEHLEVLTGDIRLCLMRGAENTLDIGGVTFSMEGNTVTFTP